MTLMPRMHNPPRPGKILRDALGDIDITTTAKKLHVSRTTLSRISNGAAGISTDMSLRLSDTLGTHDTLWNELQMSYDMGHASRKKRAKIERFGEAA
jgi:antitoxin HigA-1